MNMSPAHYISRLSRYKPYLTRRNLIIGGSILVILLGALFFIFGRGGAGVADEIKKREVSVASIAELGSNTSPLPIIGTVRSVSEATLRTEKTAEVTGVYATVGQYISAGTVIAELESASERAAVAQADAAYKKALNGTRSEQLSILEITKNNAVESLQSAEASARTSLSTAYASVDSAILQSSDAVFSNPRGTNPQFTVQTSDSSLATQLGNDRVAMGTILGRQDGSNAQTLGGDALTEEIKNATKELQTVKLFLDNVITALNKGIANPLTPQATIDTYRTSVTTARTSIITAISSLTSANDTLATKKAALAVAEKNLSQGVVGNQPEDIAVAAATLAAARATLEKALIRSPISGTINTLALSKGDFVSAYQVAAVVSNNGALEIIGYVSEAERQLISAGAKATIEDSIPGVVTSVAPGLDPDTKKAQVKIGITERAADLTQGASVSVVIERKLTTKPVTDITKKPILIPLSAIKIGSSDTVVFTVDANGALVSHVVTTGDITGDKITVTSGLTPEMEIVTDARGLKAGDLVTVKSASFAQ